MFFLTFDVEKKLMGGVRVDRRNQKLKSSLENGQAGT